MTQSLVLLLLDDKGQGRLEYTVIVAFASVAAIVALHLLGGKANGMLTNANGDLFQTVTR
jgi:Flp pilus assembly pilin Flp